MKVSDIVVLGDELCLSFNCLSFNEVARVEVTWRSFFVVLSSFSFFASCSVSCLQCSSSVLIFSFSFPPSGVGSCAMVKSIVHLVSFRSKLPFFNRSRSCSISPWRRFSKTVQFGSAISFSRVVLEAASGRDEFFPGWRCRGNGYRRSGPEYTVQITVIDFALRGCLRQIDLLGEQTCTATKPEPPKGRRQPV